MSQCPHCSSTAAIGNDAAMICVECSTVMVAGIPMSLTMMLAGAVLVVLACSPLRRWFRRRQQTMLAIS